MADNLSERLLAIKKVIDQAETREAQLQGRLDGVFARLNSEFGINSLATVDRELAKLDKELNKNEPLLAAGIEEIERKISELGGEK